MRKISLDNIQALFAKVNSEMALYLPVDKKDGKAEGCTNCFRGGVWLRKIQRNR